MLKKKIMILAILLVSLLAVSTVSATDNVTDDIVSIEETTDEIVNIDNNNQTIISVTDEMDYLNANADGTFTDLANEIDNADGELKLTKNYVYDSSKDSNFKNGIVIDKEITINGRGFIINGDKQANVFLVTSPNVILRNIEFTDCYSSISGSAISWGTNGLNGSLFDCNFIHCYSSGSNYSYGGAVSWFGANGNLYDCDFIDCYSSKLHSSSSSGSSSSSSSYNYGGAVYWDGANGNLYGCNFRNCHVENSDHSSVSYTIKVTGHISSTSSSSSYSYGGAIYWNKSNGYIFNCNFIDCYSVSYSVASSSTDNTWYSVPSSSSCQVTSYSYGGAYWAGKNGSISNCNFINSSSSYSSDNFYICGLGSHATANSYSHSYSCGGAVYWKGNDGNVSECSFINSKSESSFNYSSYSRYLQESSSNSVKLGGAVYWEGDDGYLLNSSFLNGIYEFGANHAIYWSGSNGHLFDCNFINSSLDNNKTVIWSGNEGNLFNCSFDGNYYNYEKYCGKPSTSTVYPVILIHVSKLNEDGRIVNFESTPLVNNISVKLYNVTDRKILYDEFNISSEDLTSSLNLNNLEEGEYQIVLEYYGDNFYDSTSTNDLFKIGKNPSFIVTVSENNLVGENATINLTLNEDATGKVKIVVSDYTGINELVEGRTSFNIQNLSGGINTYKIKYEGDEKYNPIYITDAFNVFLKSNISLNLKENNVFDENIALNYAITPNCTGIISIFVDNEFKANVSVGEQFELENIPVGEHNITVIYNGDEYYFTSKDSTILTVSKADPSIKVNSSNIPGPISFEVILNEKATGNVNITINNNSYYKNLTEGKVNIIIPNLNAGIYSAKVYYNGDNNYNARIYDTELTINKIPTTIVGTANDITYTQNAIINVKSSVDGVVVVKIGENYIKNISITANTVTPINFENIPAGKHDVTITLKPTNINYEESTHNTEFTVSKKQTNVVATVEDITYSENAIINVKASVDGIAVVQIDGTYLKNVNVIANTIAPVSFENIPAGKHDVTITLKPTDTNYEESTHNTEFSVSIKETSIRLDVIDSVYGNDIIVNITASEDGKVILKVGDITKEKIVFANTLTRINLGILAANSYDVSVRFDAGDNYKPSNGEGNIVVSPAEAKITDIQSNDNIYGENTVIKVKTNVNGILSVKINNNIKTFNVDANKLISFDLGICDVNTYDVDLSLDAGSNYTKATGNAKVTVNPKETTVKVNADNSVYGNKVIVKVTTSENGKVTVNVGSNVRTVDVEANKVTSVDFGILDAKSYEVNATFDGGKNYQTSSDKTSLVVSPKASTVTLVDFVNSYVYRQNVIIKMKSDTVGTLTVKVGDTPQTKQVTAGNTVTFDFGILDVNTYGVTISLDAGNNYLPYQNNTSITVTPKSTSIAINAKDYDTTEKVIVNITASENGKVTMRLGSITKTIDVNANTLTSVDFGVLDIGSYGITTNFTAGNNYIDSSATGNVKVLSKIKDEDVNIEIPETISNKDNDIVIKLPADATGTVTLIIGNNSYPFTVKDGVADIEVPKLDDGKYDYKISYSGDSKYSSFTKDGNLNIHKLIPTIIEASAVTTVYNGNKYLVITLKDSQGKPINGVTLSVNLNGAKIATTDANGQAKLTTNGLAPKAYTATITFAGNINYAKSTKTVKVTVKKATSKLTAAKKTFKKSTKTKKYTITLKTNKNKVMKNTWVTLKVNKKTYKAKTNSKGKATFKITNLKKKGKYTAVVKYAGSKYYNAKTVKAKITIK